MDGPLRETQKVQSHCLDLNDHRRGATSDNGFILKNENENEKRKEKKKKSCEPIWRAALTVQGMANQPISEKLPKWHFLSHA